MSGGSEVGAGARVRNEMAGNNAGPTVQAGEIHGDVHFHPTDGPVTPRQLPGAARHFINRAVEQDALTTYLNGTPAQGVVLISAIDGVAGVGKSTLAVQWAHRVREQFVDGELYVNLRGFDPSAEPMTSGEALSVFLSALAVPSAQIPADMESRAALFRSLLYGKKMLVLLDNARSADQVRPLLPATSSCLVLVTSRNRLDNLVVREGASRLTLEVLTDSDARELLIRYLGTDRTDRIDGEPNAADALVQHCAGLPLALGIVAVRAVENPDFPLDDLALDLQNERLRLDALEAGGETGVRAVFSWSYRSLSAEAARLFRLLGLPTSPDISLAAAADLAGTSTRTARTLLGELTRAHLLEQHAPGRFRFHDLIRAYAAECATHDEPGEHRKAAIRRLLDHYLRTSHAIDRQLLGHSRRFEPELPESGIAGLTFADKESALQWTNIEWPALFAAIQQAAAGELHVHVWQLVHSLTYFFQLRGNADEWIGVCEFALRSTRHLGDQRAEAYQLEQLSNVHFQRKQYDLAAQRSEETLPLLTAAEDREREAIVLIGLGLDYTHLQQYERADARLRRGLAIAEEIGDRGGQGYANGCLGLLHTELREFDEAFAHFQEALQLYREVGEEFGRGFVLNDLAKAHREAGQTDLAIETCQQAVGHRRALGHRRGEADSLRALGETLLDSGNTAAAREVWEQALVILDELGDDEADELRRHLVRLDA